MERGTCPNCGQTAMLSRVDNRKLLAHSVPRSHKGGCPYADTNQASTDRCPYCNHPVYKDGRRCKGTGRVAIEKLKVRR